MSDWNESSNQPYPPYRVKTDEHRVLIDRVRNLEREAQWLLEENADRDERLVAMEDRLLFLSRVVNELRGLTPTAKPLGQNTQATELPRSNMARREFVALLDLLMNYDQLLPILGHSGYDVSTVLFKYVNRIARDLGYADWPAAYLAMRKDGYRIDHTQTEEGR